MGSAPEIPALYGFLCFRIPSPNSRHFLDSLSWTLPFRLGFFILDSSFLRRESQAFCIGKAAICKRAGGFLTLLQNPSRLSLPHSKERGRAIPLPYGFLYFGDLCLVDSPALDSLSWLPHSKRGSQTPPVSQKRGKSALSLRLWSRFIVSTTTRR